MRISKIIAYLQQQMEIKGDIHLQFHFSKEAMQSEAQEIAVVMDLIGKACESDAAQYNADTRKVVEQLCAQANPDHIQRQQIPEIWDNICETSRKNPFNGEAIGSVYLIGSRRTPFTKIGFSTNPNRRLNGIQTVDPTCFLISTTEADMGYEKFLHRYFAKQRRKKEWFDLTDDHIALIRSNHLLSEYASQINKAA